MLTPLKCWVTLKSGKELAAMNAMYKRGNYIYFEDCNLKRIRIRLDNIKKCIGYHGFHVELKDLIIK